MVEDAVDKARIDGLHEEMQEEISEAGLEEDIDAASFLTQVSYSLRQAVINDLNGDAWGTVEMRRHDDICACDDCVEA